MGPQHFVIFQLEGHPLSPPPQGLEGLKSGKGRGPPPPHLRPPPLQPLQKIDHTERCLQLSCCTFTKASSTEPGRELRERIAKIGTWDALVNITEIEPGRELRKRIAKLGNWDDLDNITEVELGRELHDKNHADWHLRL